MSQLCDPVNFYPYFNRKKTAAMVYLECMCFLQYNVWMGAMLTRRMVDKSSEIDYNQTVVRRTNYQERQERKKWKKNM